jgi:hypothetical protein
VLGCPRLRSQPSQTKKHELSLSLSYKHSYECSMFGIFSSSTTYLFQSRRFDFSHVHLVCSLQLYTARKHMLQNFPWHWTFAQWWFSDFSEFDMALHSNIQQLNGLHCHYKLSPHQPRTKCSNKKHNISRFSKEDHWFYLAIAACNSQRRGSGRKQPAVPRCDIFGVRSQKVKNRPWGVAPLALTERAGV